MDFKRERILRETFLNMHLSIPKPCNENWNEMTPEQQGAFCNVCSKVVVDFSNMSDEEVLSYFENKKGEKTCGRFRASQLTPYEMKVDVRAVASQGNFPKVFAVLLFLFFSSLFICKSDTGDPVAFNISTIDTHDTAVILSVAKNAVDVYDSVSPISGNSLTVGQSVVTLPADTTQLPVTTVTDSVINSDAVMIIAPKPVKEIQHMMMGVVARPIDREPMLKGKVKCFRPTQEQNEKIIKKEHNKKKAEREKRIMGGLEL